MSKKHFLAYQRERLGLSQQELAEYLNINRSQLSKAEKNERQLPATAYLELMQLISHYSEDSNQPKPQNLIELEETTTLEIISKLIKNKEWELLLLERRLIGMEQDYKSGVDQLLAFLKIHKSLISNLGGFVTFKSDLIKKKGE